MTDGQWLTIIIVMMVLLFSALVLVIDNWISGMERAKMNELNKAELRRMAEAATGGDWEFRLGLIRTMVDSDGYVPVAIAPNWQKNWRGQRDTNMEYIAAANPAAVLSLLDECDRLQATCEGLDRQNDAIAEEIGKVAAERDAALAELEACRKDADRYRWLRDGSGWPAVFDNSDDPEPLRGDHLDAAMSREQSK